jgi:adenylate cyclase
VTCEPASAREVGAKALAAVRRKLARRAAEIIRDDPEAAAVALEIGLIDRRWLEDPGRSPVTTVGPSQMVERFWEKAVETRPSRLAQLGLGAAQLLSSRLSTPSGRPEPVSVVFTDLEGFTAFTDRHGDEAALALLRDHHREAGPIIRREGGRIVKHIGDGMLCTFGDPAGALRAAVALLETGPEPLRLRAGVHTGEALVGPDDVIGHVVNVAARVAETAAGGQAVATQETLDAAGPTPGLVTGRPRRRRLKGIADRVTLVEVSRDPAAARAVTF